MELSVVGDPLLPLSLCSPGSPLFLCYPYPCAVPCLCAPLLPVRILVRGWQTTTLLLLLLYDTRFKVEFARVMVSLYPQMVLNLLLLPSPWEAFSRLDSSLDKGGCNPRDTRQQKQHTGEKKEERLGPWKGTGFPVPVWQGYAGSVLPACWLSNLRPALACWRFFHQFSFHSHQFLLILHPCVRVLARSSFSLFCCMRSGGGSDGATVLRSGHDPGRGTQRGPPGLPLLCLLQNPGIRNGQVARPLSLSRLPVPDQPWHQSCLFFQKCGKLSRNSILARRPHRAAVDDSC